MCALALTAGLSLGGAGGPESGRTTQGLRELRQLRLELEAAEDLARKADGHYQSALERAHKKKIHFVHVAFGGYSYFEDCFADHLLAAAETATTFVHRGFYADGEFRETMLGRARARGRDLVNDVGDCAPDFATYPDEMITTLRRLIREHEDGKLRDGDSQRGYARKLDDIVDNNRELFASAPDQVLGGCEVPGFERTLRIIDASIVRAEGYTAEFLLAVNQKISREGAEKESLETRRIVLEQSLDATKELLREWRDCSTPLCADGLDNDGDDERDQADVGCASTASGGYEHDDQSEEETQLLTTLVCPPAGSSAPPESPAGSRMISTNAGDEIVSFLLRDLDTGQALITRTVGADPDALAGGPVSLGDAVCGPGTNTTVFWDVERTTITWDFVFTKVNKDVVPVAHRVVAVANTR